MSDPSMYNNLFTFSLYISNGTENVNFIFPDKSKDPTTRWIQVFSAGETGGDTMVEGEGVSVWEAGEV